MKMHLATLRKQPHESFIGWYRRLVEMLSRGPGYAPLTDEEKCSLAASSALAGLQRLLQTEPAAFEDGAFARHLEIIHLARAMLSEIREECLRYVSRDEFDGFVAEKS